MGKRDLMKTIYLLIFLVLAGTAWGGECDPYCSLIQNDECIRYTIPNLPQCSSLTTHAPKYGVVPEKGHCPHCGAKFTLEGLELYWPSGSAKYSAKVGYVYFCPNGHVFWEKD